MCSPNQSYLRLWKLNYNFPQCIQVSFLKNSIDSSVEEIQSQRFYGAADHFLPRHWLILTRTVKIQTIHIIDYGIVKLMPYCRHFYFGSKILDRQCISDSLLINIFEFLQYVDFPIPETPSINIDSTLSCCRYS